MFINKNGEKKLLNARLQDKGVWLFGSLFAEQWRRVAAPDRKGLKPT